jgi:hypothetical protein
VVEGSVKKESVFADLYDTYDEKKRQYNKEQELLSVTSFFQLLFLPHAVRNA